MGIEKKLEDYLKKNFKGNSLSLREIAKELKIDFEELYQSLIKLKQKTNLEIDEVHVVGKSSPSDVDIKSFRPTSRESILRHPLFIAISAPLVLGVIYYSFPKLVNWAVPKIYENQLYSNRRDVAFILYPEVLGNVKKLGVCIKLLDDRKELNLDEIKFSQEAYRKSYKEGLFGGDNLDKQLANFYNGVNSIDVLFKKPDLILIKSQGDNVVGDHENGPKTNQDGSADDALMRKYLLEKNIVFPRWT